MRSLNRVLPRFVPAGVVFLVAGATSTSALAQDPGIAAERFQPAPGPGNLVTVETARVPADFSYSFGLVLDYARQPLRLRHCLPGPCSDPSATIEHLDVVATWPRRASSRR